MFFKIRKKLNERYNGPVAVLDSLASRNINMFLKKDETYEFDCNKTLAEYYELYLNHLQKKVSLNNELRSLQNYIDSLSPLNDFVLSYGSKKWIEVVDEFSDEAIALVAFVESFQYPSAILSSPYYCEGAAGAYVDYIYSNRREGAYYVAGLILRFHCNFGGKYNDDISRTYFDIGIERARMRKVLCIDKNEMELPYPANYSDVLFLVKGYDEGREKYTEIAESKKFPIGVKKYQPKVDLALRIKEEKIIAEASRSKKTADVLLSSDYADIVSLYSCRIKAMYCNYVGDLDSPVVAATIDKLVDSSVSECVKNSGDLSGASVAVRKELFSDKYPRLSGLNTSIGKFSFELDAQYLLREVDSMSDHLSPHCAAASIDQTEYAIIRAIGNIAFCTAYLKSVFNLDELEVSRFQDYVIGFSKNIDKVKFEFIKNQINYILNNDLELSIETRLVNYVDNNIDNGSNPERKPLVNLFITTCINSMGYALDQIIFSAQIR